MYYVEKTKVLISGVVAMQLICVFATDLRLCVSHMEKSIFFHVSAQMYIKEKLLNDLPIFEPS